MLSAIVYTRPGCSKCRVTARKLESGGVAVEQRQIDDHDDVRSLMESEGRRALPYVEVWREGEDEPAYRWSDLRVGDIQNAIEMVSAK
ncbi:glutaredoxin domain-containing protein [Corynebacterium sp. A21]|uniref:glutaredoxin domain-containing protein n=1 Tax=Corynebacterium sp. A21 TaxID=3457318 RepID=UPI003FD59CC5